MARIEVTIGRDQPRQRVTDAIDDRARNGEQSLARRRADSPQHHREIECEQRIVAPILAIWIDVDPRRWSATASEPTLAQPAQRRLGACTVGRLVATLARHPRKPLQEITGALGVDVFEAAIGAGP